MDLTPQEITNLAQVFRNDVIRYLRTGDESFLPDEEERAFVDSFVANPRRYSSTDLFGLLKPDTDYGFANTWLDDWLKSYEGRATEEEAAPPAPPPPISTVEVGGLPGEVPVGSVPVDTGLEPAETSRPGRGQPQVSVYNPLTSTVETMPAQEALDRGLITQSEFLAAQPQTETRPAAEVAMEGAEPAPAPAPSRVGDGVVVPGAPSEIAEVPADSNIPEDWRDAAREMYPEYYAIVRNIPEIAELLELAVAGEYTPQQFQAELEQTNWWQQTTASAREWDINGERDPASQQTLIDNQITNIRSIALNQFGVRLSNENLQALAVDSLRLGWSSAFLQNAIGDVATQSTAGISQLRAGYIGQQLRETANDYGIAVSDATFNQWVNKVAVGQETVATWQDYAKVQAKNLFPSIADRIDAGETFQQIVDPYRQTAAKVLELGTGEDIDFTAPEWAKAVTFMDSEGNQRPMSYTEWNDYLRQTRSFGYEYTTEARSRAYSVAQDLANIFGRA